METRRIVGFNDEIEFEVLDNSTIKVIDNGTSYKNVLRNGLLLDTLCEMEFSDIIWQQEQEEQQEQKEQQEEQKKQNRTNINYDIEENISDNDNSEKRKQVNKIKERKNTNKNWKNINKNQKNTKEQRRRNKYNLLKNGNDYKIRNRYYEDHKTFCNKKISTTHFGKNETNKYAPLCNDCYVFAMLTKTYCTLYKCSYNTQFCPKIKCWKCADNIIYDHFEHCNEHCAERFDICDYTISFYDMFKYAYIGNNIVTFTCKCDDCGKKYLERCNCGEEYGYDYGKKYKCGRVMKTYFGTRNEKMAYDYEFNKDGIEVKMYNEYWEAVEFHRLESIYVVRDSRRDLQYYNTDTDTDTDVSADLMYDLYDL